MRRTFSYYCIGGWVNTSVEMVLIGLDIGNTSLKALAFTPSGRIVARVSQPTQRIKTAEMHIHGMHLTGLLEPRLLLEVVQDLLSQIQRRVGQAETPYEIRAVAVTGMGGPMVALDQNDNPVYPVIGLWPIDIHETALDGSDQTFYEVTGYHLHNSPFVTMVWLAQHDPARFARVKGILPVVSYVTFALSGMKASDPSMASGTGIWDQGCGKWARQIIQSTPVRFDCFPVVSPAGTALGPPSQQFQESTGLPSDTLVAVGGHDYLCAAGALGITKPGMVLNMLGTYEIFATPHHSASVVQPSELDLIDDTHVYPHTRSLMFQVIGGGHLEWLRRLLTGGLDESASMAQWIRILDGAARMRDDDMVDLVFAPFLFGRFFPERCIHPHGALLGLSDRHGPEHVSRAMIDALSYVSMEALKTLTAVSGEEVTKIVVSGGGTQNRLWVQRKADFLQTALQVPDVMDTSALGAAILAGLAVGVYSDWDQAAAALDINWAEITPKDPIDPRYLDQFIRWDDVSPNACAHTVDLSRRIAHEILVSNEATRIPPTGA